MRAAFLLPIVVLLTVGGCSTPKDSSAKSKASGAAVASQVSPSPAAEATAPSSEMTSELPLTSSEEASIRGQIERNWNIAAGREECPIEQQELVELRIYLDPNGTVTKVEPITDVSKDKCLLRTYDGARRAVMISSPLRLPPGKTYATMNIRFSPAEAVQ